VNRLNHTLETRARRTGTARLTSAEVKVIDRLSLWGQLTVPIVGATPTQEVRAPSNERMPIKTNKAQEAVLRSPVENGTLLKAVYYMASDPREFTTAFNLFLSEAGEGRDPQECLRSFVALWDQQH
jgi:hypothetical protein